MNYALNFILILSLLFTPISNIWAEEDTSISGQRATCASRPGFYWNTSLNRCMAKEDTAQFKKDTEACDKITDTEQKKSCMLSLAQMRSNVTSDPSKANLANSKVLISTAYGVLGALFMFGAIEDADCPSKTIFGVTALAGTAADWFIKFKANKKSKELRDKYKIDTSTNSYHAQSKALEYLKDEQGAVLDLAKKEKIRNMAITAGFAAASITAIVEMISPSTFPNCYKPSVAKDGAGGATKDGAGGAAKGSTGAEQTTTTTTVTKTTTTTGPNGATSTTSSTTTANPGTAVAAKMVGNGFTSPIVLTASAVGTFYSAILMNAADKQVTECKQNISRIDELLASFKDIYKNDCVNGRDSLSEPRCYCYKDDGSKNTSRSNSKTCQDEWAKRDYTNYATADNYRGESTEDPDAKGCITTAGKFDEGCKCKKFVDKTGNNACKKSITVSLPSKMGQALDKNTNLADLLKYTNSLGSGSIGSLSSNVGSKAVSAKKLKDSFFNKLPEDIKSRLPSDNLSPLQAEKISKALIGEKNYSRAVASTGGSNLNVERSVEPKVEKLLEEAGKKAGIEMSGTGKGMAKNKENKDSYNFNYNDSGTSAQGPVAVEFMDKKYNFKDSDINKTDNVSIFEIISNRYVESGLRRLFSEE